MNVFEQLSPMALSFLASVLAGAIGYLLWRIFQLALKLVLIVVVVLIGVGVLASWRPEVFGLTRRLGERLVDEHGPAAEALRGAEEAFSGLASPRPSLSSSPSSTASPSSPSSTASPSTSSPSSPSSSRSP
jgi:hypothetical protein